MSGGVSEEYLQVLHDLERRERKFVRDQARTVFKKREKEAWRKTIPGFIVMFVAIVLGMFALWLKVNYYR